MDQRVIELWLVAVLLAMTACFATRWRRRLGIVPVALAMLLSLGMWQELSDPATAEGLALDLGEGYLLHSRIAGWSSLVLTSIAWVIAARSRRSVVGPLAA